VPINLLLKNRSNAKKAAFAAFSLFLIGFWLLITGFWRFARIVFFNKLHNLLPSGLHLASLKRMERRAPIWQGGRKSIAY